MARGRGEVSWGGPATTACRPQASHPLNQLPGLAVTRGNGEKSRDAGLEAEWGAPWKPEFRYPPPAPRPPPPPELLRYLGLAGAEVPYANSSLLSEEKILQMALCNLL